MVNATPWPLYPREGDPVPTVKKAGWAPGPVWTGAENLAPTGIRSLGRPARSELLHRLRYPGPRQLEDDKFFLKAVFCLTKAVVLRLKNAFYGQLNNLAS